jgi:hypothetical protein
MMLVIQALLSGLLFPADCGSVLALAAHSQTFMKPADIFKLIVKILGAFLLYQAVSLVPDFLITVAKSPGVGVTVLIKLVGLAAAAVWFLLGAPPIQRFAYPETEAKPDSSTTKVQKAVPPANGPACVSCGKPTPVGSEICPSCGWAQPK